MKILYISDSLGNLGGAAKSGREVLENMVSKDHDITVVSFDKKKSILKIANGDLSRVHRWIAAPREVEFPKRFNSRFTRDILKWMVWKLRNIFRGDLKTKLSRLNPEIVFVNSIGSHELFEECGYNKQCRSIMIFRGSPSHFTIPDNAPFTLEEAIEILDSYNEIVFVSSIVRDKWLSIGRLANKKAYYIPNSCDEKEVSIIRKMSKRNARHMLRMPEGKQIVVCIATLQYHKGQDIIVENIHKIIENLPDIKMYLIGKPIYPWGTMLVRKIKTMGIDKFLTVLGHKEDVLNYIYAADLLVFPTKVEAMPRVIIEAMALGTPIVATDVDGIPELIEHFKSGLLFSPEESDIFLKYFYRLISDSDERESFGKRGKEIYWSKFSRDLQTARYEQLLTRN